ncbi:speckle-type POZ protein-like isoform X2 [Microplitis mediator]|uniref:speckle-type POZ protein-like isoform X2 n=1 Tax=Microplitis mediator TaxID=375433 RepID=UPI0025542E17|nr:speckle-type POZ protein-like isoform X2 [Microplitis mediator]
MEILGYSDSREHQIIYKWNINKVIPFIECSKNDPKHVKLESSKFRTPANSKNLWYLRLRIENDEPSGKKKKWISLFLCRDDGKDELRMKFSLFILDNKNERKFEQTYYATCDDTNNGRGSSKFIKIEQLLENNVNLLPNNTLTVCVELTIYDDYKSFTTGYPLQIPQRQMVDDFRELYDSKVNSDVILVVGGEKFKAHKFILSTRSPVFFAMFTHEMKEKRDSEVAIPDIEPEIFRKMLEFIYTDEINNLDTDAADLLEAADKYQLLKLKNLHNANQLLEFIFEFVIRNIKDVIKTPEYEVLEKSKSLLLSKLIKKLADLNEN